MRMVCPVFNREFFGFVLLLGYWLFVGVWDLECKWSCESLMLGSMWSRVSRGYVKCRNVLALF